jgi:preprotein translocase subunit YajC
VDPSVLLLLISLGLLVLVLTSRRRQQREQQTLQARLVPGAEVMTGSGMYATIVSLGDDVVVLQTGPGQHARWDRRAIARLLSVPDEPDDDEPGADAIGEDETVASSDHGDDPAQGNVSGSGDDIGPKETGQSTHG